MANSQNSLKSFYKEHSKQVRISGRVLTILRFLSSVLRGGTVLDVGCGNGLISTAMSIYSKNVTGIDIETDICEFEPDTRYQTVTCFDVLEHIHKDKRAKAVWNMCRLAEHNVVFNIPNHTDESQPYDEKVDWIWLIEYMSSQGFRLNYFSHYVISDIEAYNFMEFVR